MRKIGVRSPGPRAGAGAPLRPIEVGAHEPLHEAHHGKTGAHRVAERPVEEDEVRLRRPAPAPAAPSLPAWLAAGRPGRRSGVLGHDPRHEAQGRPAARDPDLDLRAGARLRPRPGPARSSRPRPGRRGPGAAWTLPRRSRAGRRAWPASASTTGDGRCGARRRRRRCAREPEPAFGRTACQAVVSTVRPRGDGGGLGLADLDGRVVLGCEGIEAQSVGCGGHDRGECSLAGDPIRSARSSASP